MLSAERDNGVGDAGRKSKSPKRLCNASKEPCVQQLKLCSWMKTMRPGTPVAMREAFKTAEGEGIEQFREQRGDGDRKGLVVRGGATQREDKTEVIADTGENKWKRKSSERISCHHRQRERRSECS